MPHLPIEVLRGRIRRARELGLDYKPMRPCRQAHSRCGETRVPAPLAFEAGAEYGTRNTLRSLSHERCEDRIFGRDIHY